MKPITTRATLFALCLAALGMLGACSADDAPETGGAGGNSIALVPTLAAPTYTGGDGAQTRREYSEDLQFEPGGNIVIKMYKDDPAVYQQNTFTMTESYPYKMVRKAYVAGSGDTEADLSVKEAGNYHFSVSGYANCRFSDLAQGDGLAFKVPLKSDATTAVAVAADGKVSIPCSLAGACISLVVRKADDNSYADGSKVSVTLNAAVKDTEDQPITASSTITGNGCAVWGNLAPHAFAAGDELMRITVSIDLPATTYKVLAPKAFSLTAGRFVAFSVRVGATGITVQMKDGNNAVIDFVVEPVTTVEAMIPGMYNGTMGQKLAITGMTPYWIAPTDATVTAGTLIKDIPFATLCPAGWHVPTTDDFKAMTGFSVTGGPPVSTYAAELKAAFNPRSGSSATAYLTGTLNVDRYNCLSMFPDGSTYLSAGHLENDAFNPTYDAVRCVQKAR